jgi:hypothetical protein
MRQSHLVFLALAFISAVQFSSAQQAPEEIPQAVAALRQSASSKTEFTLGHSMLVFVSRLDADDADLRRVIAGVSEVSVHNYRFSGAWTYDPESLQSVKEDYRAAGWKHLVNKGGGNGGPGMTDLWIRFEHHAIANVAILVARSSEVTFIVVSGSISPLDLTHLAGHFGIPKIEGGVEVPNLERR